MAERYAYPLPDKGSGYLKHWNKHCVECRTLRPIAGGTSNGRGFVCSECTLRRFDAGLPVYRRSQRRQYTWTDPDAEQINRERWLALQRSKR